MKIKSDIESSGTSVRPIKAAGGVPKAREQALREWRRTHNAALEELPELRAKSSKDILSSVSKGLKLDERLIDVEIVKVWNHLLDPVIVEHARPCAFAKGTLYVSVDSNVWLNEIVRYRRQEILRRMQASFGSKYIARLSFRVE
jgi:hypothetical protein